MLPLVVVSLALLAGPAHAHINLLSPTPRTMQLKSGPCGAGPNDPRGPTVATFKPGEKIMVTFDEFIDHPGHYRVAFDDDGQDIFVDPKSFEDVSGGPGVLIDGIFDKNGGEYDIEVTLPEVECDTCVLQVIQVMTDKPPYGDGNDMYYQCADIALQGEVAATTSGEPGTTGEPGATEPDPSAGETAGETAGESTGTPNPSAGETGGASDPQTSDAPTGDAPTSGGAGASTGGASMGGASMGAASDGAETMSTTDDEGCGCRGADKGGWLALGLLPLLLPRRRRG